MENKMHTIGVAFTNTSKKGTKYITLQLFRPPEEEPVKVLGFFTQSKKGNKYIKLVLPEGKKDLEKLKAHLQKHIDSLETKQGNFDNKNLVENILYNKNLVENIL